uniref:Uncharacterized protein n=1 Tax=Psilocybe cubensis TaxID=181762 RepID=A0A8H8CF42_PSICU
MSSDSPPPTSDPPNASAAAATPSSLSASTPTTQSAAHPSATPSSSSAPTPTTQSAIHPSATAPSAAAAPPAQPAPPSARAASSLVSVPRDNSNAGALPFFGVNFSSSRAPRPSELLQPAITILVVTIGYIVGLFDRADQIDMNLLLHVPGYAIRQFFSWSEAVAYYTERYLAGDVYIVPPSPSTSTGLSSGSSPAPPPPAHVSVPVPPPPITARQALSTSRDPTAVRRTAAPAIAPVRAPEDPNARYGSEFNPIPVGMGDALTRRAVRLARLADNVPSLSSSTPLSNSKTSSVSTAPSKSKGKAPASVSQTSNSKGKNKRPASSTGFRVPKEKLIKMNGSNWYCDPQDPENYIWHSRASPDRNSPSSAPPPSYSDLPPATITGNSESAAGSSSATGSRSSRASTNSANNRTRWRGNPDSPPWPNLPLVSRQGEGSSASWNDLSSASQDADSQRLTQHQQRILSAAAAARRQRQSLVGSSQDSATIGNSQTLEQSVLFTCDADFFNHGASHPSLSSLMASADSGTSAPPGSEETPEMPQDDDDEDMM